MFARARLWPVSQAMPLNGLGQGTDQEERYKTNSSVVSRDYRASHRGMVSARTHESVRKKRASSSLAWKTGVGGGEARAWLDHPGTTRQRRGEERREKEGRRDGPGHGARRTRLSESNHQSLADEWLSSAPPPLFPSPIISAPGLTPSDETRRESRISPSGRALVFKGTVTTESGVRGRNGSKQWTTDGEVKEGGRPASRRTRPRAGPSEAEG